MTLRKIVNPSDQTQAFLPNFVGENYQTFVNFMARSAESAERQGFGQDLLQNLLRYRDFSTFASGIVESGILATNITEDEEDELTLEDGVGFPLENGVILIGDEVILYRTRNGNTLSYLQRSASATTVLPSLYSAGQYKEGPAQEHLAGSEVKNVSSLFLSAMLSNIHESFTPNIYADKVSPEVDRSILLQNIKDFYGAKGSKLSVIALFKFIYGDADVDVLFPGDQMIRPSSATWQQFRIGSAKPFPVGLLGENGVAFDNKVVLGSQLKFRKYGDPTIYGTAIVEFATQSILSDGVGFTLYLDSNSFKGRVDLANSETPSTVLKRNLLYYGSVTSVAADVSTVTVDSTNDFPESGVFFVGGEAISYTSKSNNQFFGCSRAVAGHGSDHPMGQVVYGANYAELTLADGHYTQVWISALYNSADVTDSGILYKASDSVAVSLPGDTDYRDPILTTLQENTNDTLVTMSTTSNITDVSDVTVGISAIYYDKDNVLVESSGLPDYNIGPFSTDGSVGPDLKDNASSTHVIPRKDHSDLRTGYSWQKVATGSGRVGVYIDGTPIVSVRNGNKLVSGKITGFQVKNGGQNYGTVTAVFEPEGATANVEVIEGTVIDLTIDQNANYTEIPTVRISEGEGAIFSLNFDQWGRLTNVDIVSGGQYYFEPPTLILEDASGVGGGATLACTVSALGQINSVTITSPGLDYRPSTTSLKTRTAGTGAEVIANVETYNFNRVDVINRSATELKDSGNGILAALNPGDNKDTFALAESHIKLIEELSEGNNFHSPLIGWAYDGNPIYGPRGYTNTVDGTDGISPVAAGYALQSDRATVIPEGGTDPGTLPPDTSTYPMGTFVEDFIFDPENASVIGYVQTELDQTIQDDPDSRSLRYQFEFGDNILDQFNGRICNTPEFPADKYPDGVYCYFTTIFGEFGTFPYVIGPEFRDTPTSQNIVVYNGDQVVINSAEDSANYTDSVLDVQQRNIKRLRSLSIPAVQIKPVFEVVDILPGVVDSVVCVKGSPDNATIRDTFYFNNEGTQGDGAAAIVEELMGRDIESAVTTKIQTRLISHTQRINLSEEENSDFFVFIPNSTIQSTGGAIARVINYDYGTKFLDVHVTTSRLIRFGDTITDNAGNRIVIPTSKYPSNTLFSSETTGTRSTFASWEEPDRTSAKGGDLWWSSKTGRLYVYFDNGTTGNWVTTQPSGSRSFYADSPDTLTGVSSTTTQSFATPQGETSVTISTMAPSERSDSTPNASGDLWWSTYTGMLYIWVVETSTNDDNGILKSNAQWVATDPTAALTKDGDQSQELSILGNNDADPNTYTQRTEVLMAEGAPIAMPDGTDLLPGTLWWSPASGKMYIYYNDGDTSQWVVTNPTTTQTGPEAIDTLITGDGTGTLDYITQLPVPANETDLWLEPNMYSGDIEVNNQLEIRYGAPGTPELTERVYVKELNSEKGNIRVVRSKEGAIELTNGAEVTNINRYHFRVTCDINHDLLVGNTIDVSGTPFPAFNGPQKVYRTGAIKKAQFTAVVIDEEVRNITIDDPGAGYTERFYLTIYGGGGLGATAVAFIDEDSGSVISVSVQSNGSGYTSVPSITHNPELTTNEFLILTGRDYGNLTDTFSYTTTSESIFGTPSKIRMLSKGQNYYDLPEVVGLIRSADIAAETRAILDGTVIAGFTILKKGFGYKEPVAVIDDLTGAGSGATATVRVDENGSVTSIAVTNGGSGYVEPVITLVESKGTYIANTKDIGRIRGFQLLEPSSIVNADTISYPELQPPLRIVVGIADNNFFSPGEEVWQGEETNKLFSATVQAVNKDNYVVELVDYDGNIDMSEPLYGDSTFVGTVYSYDESDFKLSTSSIAEPAGRFINETGALSSSTSVIQDSYYYQHFSYVISSSKQKDEFEGMVKNTTHPTGTIMFAETKIDLQGEMDLYGETAVIG